LTEEEREALEQTALQEDLSIAQVVRRGIREVTKGAPRQRSHPEKPRLRKASKPVDRDIEARWLSEHQADLEAYRSEWVVVEGEGIAAHGTNLKTLVQETRRMGIEIPYVVWVPREKTNAVMMGL